MKILFLVVWLGALGWSSYTQNSRLEKWLKILGLLMAGVLAASYWLEF